ncbi:MAG TPA: transglutaminase domain-containing protein [Woeseiaceae bacterium]|nr:transglutaminase domain-containing protein [Woeseiaceae bacterium]
MWSTALLLSALCIGLPPGAAAAGTASSTDDSNYNVAALQTIISSIDAGQFRVAEEAIAKELVRPGLSPEAQEKLLFQRERMQRILLDFTLDTSDVFAQVREQIPDLGEAEFTRWDSEGLFEYQLIDGQRRYFNRSPSNLFRLSADARARRKDQVPLIDGPMEALNEHHREVHNLAIANESSSVAPQRVRVTQSITVDSDAVPAGETVRAWIPFPREIPGQQEEIEVLASDPPARIVAPATALQRTVYFEKKAVAGEATMFSVSYELTVFGRYISVNSDNAVPATITPELAPFVAERPPHIVFNESMRVFSRQIVGDETNPWRIAQRLFAAVDNIPWAGAREYSTITNISDYALHAGHADCGQQTLLLMTLLRLNGIPARWQSGMVYSDQDYWNLHDWGQVYIAPYGWMPMDVTFGRFASGNSLEWFYLGGLDAFRIAFNDDFGQQFEPPKQHMRSETVDSQRGEVEWSGANLYFDQWDYSFNAELVQ